MKVRAWVASVIAAAISLASVVQPASAAPRKHVVVLGSARKVPYSKAGDPAGASAGESFLKIRSLMVDSVLKEWTTGDPHDVTDRSFVVRRAIRINDTLPGDAPPQKQGNWVWQRGPWLLIDRVSGHVTALKLPYYDPGVSQVIWFRDYGAYCGLTASGKSLYAVVAQVSVRKALLAKKLRPFEREDGESQVCKAPEWQRDPLRITFHPVEKDAVSFDFVPGSTVLVENAADDPDAP